MESHVVIDPNDRNVVDVIYASTTCLPTEHRKISHKTGENDRALASRELLNIIVLSASFTLAYVTYLSLQMLQSSLHQSAGLGVLCLSVIYIVSILSSFITPILINGVGIKGTFVLSWCVLASYTAANFYPSWETLLPAGLLVGIIINPLWSSHATYVSQRAFNYASLTGKNLGKVLAKFNGIFFTMYNFSIVIGNLTSSVVLNPTVQESHFNESQFHEQEFVAVPVCGANDCPSMAATQNVTASPPEPRNLNILLGVFFSLNLICVLITCLFLQPLAKTARQPVRTVMASCCRMALTDVKLMLVLPLSMAETFFQAFIYAEFTKNANVNGWARPALSAPP